MTPLEALDVAAQFGIATEGARVVALPGGYSNENARVDAASGSFVVRRYGRLHVTRAAIEFEHIVVERAAARMSEVVAPLRDPAGATIVEAPSGGLASVSPYIAGETGRRDLPTAEAAVTMLARFHVAARNIRVGSGLRSARFVGTMSWLRERFVRFAADRLVGRALDWNVLIAGATAATARVAPLAERLPVAIVHGDMNPENVVAVDAGQVRGLIDFDFVHETERMYDVGIAVDEFARAGDDERLDLARVAPLIAAYAADAPLSAEERATLPDQMLRHAAMLAWYVTTRHGERVPGDVGAAPRYAARVAEIAASAEAIRDAARGYASS
jgi:Ser/Thr protein kinase RdoA (MazF antagonist)